MLFRRQLGNNSVLVLFPSRAGFKKRNLSPPPFFPSECRRRFSLSPVLLRFLSFISAAAAGPGPTGEGPAFGPRPIFFSVRPSGVIRQRGKKEVSPVPPRSSHTQLGSRGTLAKLEFISMLARVFLRFKLVKTSAGDCVFLQAKAAFLGV